MKLAEQEKIELYPGMMLQNPSTSETYLLLEIQENAPLETYGPKLLLLELSTGKHYHRRRNFITFWDVL
jgi:hypothetical protein